MLSMGIALARLGKGVVHGFADPQFRALLLVLVLAIFGGTLFYHGAEGWSWVDSAYYATMTLATLSPEGHALKSDFSKIFTIIYVLAGVGVMISFAVALGSHIAGTPSLPVRLLKGDAEDEDKQD